MKLDVASEAPTADIHSWRAETLGFAIISAETAFATKSSLIDSLFAADPSARNFAYIAHVRPERIEFFDTERNEWILQRTQSRASINHGGAYCARLNTAFLSAVALASQLSIQGWCLCREDITFQDEFVVKLLASLNEATQLERVDFILSAYSPYNLNFPPRCKRGRYYVHYPAGDFHGGQCLVIPKRTLRGLDDYKTEQGMSFSISYDLLINHYCRLHENLYCTKNSLVQNISTSSKASGENHRSPTFDLKWPLSVVTLNSYRAMASAIIAASYSEPFITGDDRGIVICAGGVKYFTCAWITIKILRKLGCKLPVELWHLGPEEMTTEMANLADLLGVRCVDALEVREKAPVRILHGWELKCYALLHSNFREILLLDADNVPVRNPEYLFKTRQFRKTGAIFWPDIGRLGPEKEIWDIVEVPYDGQRDFESGQIVVDKSRCWRALKLAMHYNEHSDFYYQYIYGDKDTFRFAFQRTQTPFSMPDRGIDFIDGTLCQHDFRGRRIFQHRIKKWSLNGKNSLTPGFIHEETCLEYLEELREKWTFGIPSAARLKNLYIPRILHRVWLCEEPLSVEQRRWAETWQKFHPEWEVRNWTADSLPNLINKTEIASLTNPQQRMEIVSYELLHQFGGVYVDADFECLRPIDGLLAGKECVLGEESPGRVCHGLLAGIPGHEFFKHLTRSVRNSLCDHARNSAAEQTGANFVTRNLRNRNDVTVLPSRYFHPRPHSFHSTKCRKNAEQAYACHHPSLRWAPLRGIAYERRVLKFSKAGKTLRELSAAQMVAKKCFDYHRIGYDRRRLKFLTNGSFGEGKGECEKTWDIFENSGELKLRIFGPNYVTCELTDCGDGSWRGAWLIGEKMPVELAPATSGIKRLQ